MSMASLIIFPVTGMVMQFNVIKVLLKIQISILPSGPFICHAPLNTNAVLKLI